MTQHAQLTAERWSAFTRAQQVLQIAAEMHRATRFVDTQRIEYVRSAYERALRLTELTAQVQAGPSFRRELLRWRMVLAELYLAPAVDPARHRLALRTLLELNPEAARQIRYLLA
ncbi:MAG: hypothetical protein U1F29_10380 [Planctomycetota bacterium]